MITTTKLRINGGRLTSETVIPDRRIELSWAIGGEGRQSGYSVAIYCKEEKIYDSGFVKSARITTTALAIKMSVFFLFFGSE